jgi:dTDP-4-dehydrorhamnose reductase
MRVLLTGASGQLGAYLLRELTATGRQVVAWSGSRAGRLFGVELHPVDLSDPSAIAAAFADARPEAVLHAGAMAGVADCLREPDRAERVNTGGTRTLADLCGRAGVRLLFVSTDLVFDGEHAPYREDATPAPLSHYGRTKAAAEDPVRAAGGLVVRVSLLFGPSLTDRPTFFDQQVAALRSSKSLTLFADEWRTPLSLAVAARALTGLLTADDTGVLHLGGPERMSRLEMGRRLADSLNVAPTRLASASRLDVTGLEPRPRDVSLDSSLWRSRTLGAPWPAWDEALRELGVA